MRDLLEELLLRIQGAWLHRWSALGTAWAVAALSWGYTLLIPDQYEAAASVYVDTESTLRPLMRGLAVEADVMSQVRMMTTALLSRPQLEKIARQTDLDLRAANPQQLDSLVTRLQEQIRVSGGRDGTYTISYSDRDRAMALDVVRSLLDNFVEDTLGQGRADSSNAQQFLEEQLVLYERRLKNAEDRLAKFKQDNVGLMPDDRGDYYQRLQGAMHSLNDIEARRGAAETRLEELRRQLRGEEPVFGIMSGPSTRSDSRLDSRIAEMEGEIDQLLLRFTENHPEVASRRQIIEQLEQERAAELANMPLTALAPGDSSVPLELNPVYQNMRMMLHDAEVQVATLRHEAAQQQARINELQRLVDTVPEVEAQLTQLNRDYDVTRTAYESLLQRLEQARLSEQVEQRADGFKFRIIDPPNASFSAIYPPRVLMIPLLLMVSLGAGIGMAIFLAEVKPVYLNRRQLTRATGLPVLATVTYEHSSRELLRERFSNLLLMFGFAALVITAVLATAFHTTGARLLQGIVT